MSRQNKNPKHQRRDINLANKNPKHQRRDNRCANITQNPPSFKISGLMVLCVFGFLLFGFTPQANAGDISSTDMLMINILRPICEVMYIGSQAIQHITGALSSLL